jgi:hypothetical protein
MPELASQTLDRNTLVVNECVSGVGGNVRRGVSGSAHFRHVDVYDAHVFQESTFFAVKESSKEEQTCKDGGSSVVISCLSILFAWEVPSRLLYTFILIPKGPAMPFFENWWQKSYTHTAQRVTVHALFWTAYLCFLGSTAYEHLRTSSSVPVPVSALPWLIPVYLVWVYYFLMSAAYERFQKKQSGNALSGALLALLLYIHSDILFSWIVAGKLAEAGVPNKPGYDGTFCSFYRQILFRWFAVFHFLFGFVVYLVLPVVCKAFRDLQRSQRQFHELKERNMQLELNLIKSQVNPHFLLNTLNNIYGFSITGTRQQIGEMLLHLSGFLKYSLYECSNEYVALGKEIKLMRSYVELEQVRSDFIDVSLEMDAESERYRIPPFILFPLVENAFKHGTKNLTAPTHIDIRLLVKSGKLTFIVENDVQPGETTNGGFGLLALKKKLEHYYPSSSTLNSLIAGGRYIAQLQITGL